METENRQKLIEKLSAIDNAVSLPQLKKAVEEMLRFEIKLQNKTETELKTIAESVKTAISRIESLAQENHDSTSQKLSTELETMMNKMILEHESMMSECDAKMNDMKDGEDADEEVIVSKVLALIPPPETIEEETPESVRDMLESIENEDDKLKIDAISHLREELDKLEKSIREQPRTVVGSHSIGVQDEGTDVNLNARYLNFTGAGVSVSQVGEVTVVQIAEGAGNTPAQESGTVSGTTITLGHTPVTNTFVLYINGQFQHPVTDYTLTGLTVSALPASANGLTYTAIYEY